MELKVCIVRFSSRRKTEGVCMWESTVVIESSLVGQIKANRDLALLTGTCPSTNAASEAPKKQKSQVLTEAREALIEELDQAIQAR